MVEITQNDVDALVFLPEKVLDGHFHVVKGDIGSTCC